MKPLKVWSVLALVSAMTVAWAQPGPSGQGGQDGQGGHRGPPPEALAACKTLKAGADCSFAGRDQTVKGQCWAPENRPLACRPKDMGERPPGPPSGGASAPRR